uniref:Uncharacterized protein n=1 Tax=Arundo donax TaxID=35708 RepID=A0A0A8XQS7_ARUDO
MLFPWGGGRRTGRTLSTATACALPAYYSTISSISVTPVASLKSRPSLVLIDAERILSMHACPHIT